MDTQNLTMDDLKIAMQVLQQLSLTQSTRQKVVEQLQLKAMQVQQFDLFDQEDI